MVDPKIVPMHLAKPIVSDLFDATTQAMAPRTPGDLPLDEQKRVAEMVVERYNNDQTRFDADVRVTKDFCACGRCTAVVFGLRYRTYH